MGDENVPQTEQPLYSAVDMVVPPRAIYKLPVLPNRNGGRPARLRAAEVWHVQARSHEEGEHLQRQAEEAQAYLEQLRGVQESREKAGAARSLGSKETRQAKQWRQQRLKQNVNTWGANGLKQQQQDTEELLETLQQMVGSGTAEAAVHPQWHDQLEAAVVPVCGVNAG